VYNASKEVLVKKQLFVRWVLVFGILAALLASCGPPNPRNGLPNIPSATQQQR
jgi:hypothetical protein